MFDLASNLTHSLRRWKVLVPALTVAVGLVMCSFELFAQSGAGSIQGTVTDATGAVIPGATIHVVNNGTNVSTDTTSNNVGFYQVPALFAGTYTVTITAPNMKTYKTSIQILVAQAAIINPVLTAGAVTQQVEVAASAIQLTTTDNGTITSTLENARINQMPLNGRVLTSLVGMMAPGVEGGQRANGLMAEALEYVADGVPLSNRQFGGMNQSQAQSPDPDSVQEVRVETTNTSAMYTEPGTVIITTKSGTNQLHGSAFETARNNAIGNAKPRTINYILPHLVRNEFGASVGGPIILPHVYHGKDKSFFFFAYEKYSLASSTPENVTVPTAAMKAGDWSQLVNGSNVQQVLYDFRTTQNSAACAANGGAANPYCRTPFPNNQIPIGLLSPTMKMIYDITQSPGTTDNPFQNANLSSPNPNNTFIPTISFRFDHAFNENNRAYLRYTSNVQVQKTLRNYPSNSPYTIAADGFPFQASGIAYNPSATYAAAIGYTHVFSPTFFSETIVSQQWFSQHNYAGGTPFANFEQKLGLPNNFGEAGFPNFGSTLICPYGGTQFIYGLSQIVDNLDENLTKTINRHQLHFGGRYRHERFGYLPDMLNDQISFGSQATGVYDSVNSVITSSGNVTNTGNQNGDAFIGAASSYSVNKQPPYAHFHDMEFDAYFQDDFHVSRDLTINLGVRWESHPATWLKGGTMQAFDLKNDAEVLASTPAQLIAGGFTTQAIITNLANIGAKIETPQQAGLPDKLVYDYNLNFSPRVGIAYTPWGGRHGLVLRGAYGRYIYPIPTRTTYKPILQNNPYTAGYSTSYTSSAQTPDGYPNYLLRVNSLPVVMGVNSANVVNSSTTTSLLPGINLYTLNPLQPPDFVSQANFTIEQALKGNSALRITYLFSHGTNLDQEFYYNAHPSTFTWEVQTGTTTPNGGASTIGTNQYASTGTGTYDKITWGGSQILDQKSGWSNTNALQANYQRLFHGGFAYQISYVFSKTFRQGGNYFRDGLIVNNAAYGASGISTWAPSVGGTGGIAGTLGPYRLPPPPPTGTAPWGYYRAMSRWADYHLDQALPIHHVQFNGIYDIPFGTGKKFIAGANRWMNMLVGGWQIAGDGNILSQHFLLTAATSTTTPGLNWGPIGGLKIYKHAKRMTDCTSGVCRQAFEWFNGYISPNQTSGCVGAKCITGYPSDQPFQTPINTNYNPATAGGTAQDTNYNTNNVTINLSNGKTDRQGFTPGGGVGQQQFSSNPWASKVLTGPFNYTVDASLFKTIAITERIALRFNFDVFNLLNMQGYVNPSVPSGEELMTSSYNSPRQVQMTLRLQF